MNNFATATSVWREGILAVPSVNNMIFFRNNSPGNFYYLSIFHLYHCNTPLVIYTSHNIVRLCAVFLSRMHDVFCSVRYKLYQRSINRNRKLRCDVNFHIKEKLKYLENLYRGFLRICPSVNRPMGLFMGKFSASRPMGLLSARQNDRFIKSFESS